MQSAVRGNSLSCMYDNATIFRWLEIFIGLINDGSKMNSKLIYIYIYTLDREWEKSVS